MFKVVKVDPPAHLIRKDLRLTVDNPEDFIKLCSKKLKKERLFFLSTLNRTWQSYLGAIIGAEYILGWVPKGTHDWKKFIPPSALAALLREADLQLIDLKGIGYKPVTGQWIFENTLNINYISCSVLT